MTVVVPFVGRITGRERRESLDALNARLREIRVMPVEDMTEGERRTARVAVVANPDVEMLRRLPMLEWVQSLWAGVEQLVSELPHERIRIVRMTDPQLATTMAEAVLAWTLYLHRDMPRYRVQQEEARWVQHPLVLPRDRPIGILGMGRLGLAAARKLAENGFPVTGWSRRPWAGTEFRVLNGPSGLEAVLQQSAVVVVLLPLTPQTRHLLDDWRFGQLRKGAALINFARGPIIDRAALLRALDRADVGHAVLDVFDVEPLPPDDPLWRHPRVTVLPHISAPTRTGSASDLAAANLQLFFDRGIVPTGIDREAGY
ncbi:2-hydroxyacid dehydrogenase [Swaminathania salitolerans]|uniref:Glyoxylate/hydroxypyruvate reductase A n=1 Tax=Swaminathania salitolerans TaxID=182838 RepID=A0A511BSE6_9PROT|nr:glyoxylate/hydroxypyruvate reductase A [Swaminathania salitolerans]GBQ09791.1 D-isomer specific 2-hydroxyacid dehydrogenase NAD-binding protein [Swaminathania salitolerans LMG 21291]GEL00848.1 glyoxylate/hydroxypyruvate reductase A [Swaminathania salitolerans]